MTIDHFTYSNISTSTVTFRRMQLIPMTSLPRNVTHSGSYADNDAHNVSACDMMTSEMAGPPPAIPQLVRIALVALLSCVPVVTLAGNCLVVLTVMTHRKFRTVTNSFVVSLAVADLCVALFVMPLTLYNTFTTEGWMLGEALCKMSIILDVMMCTVSIFHLSCLAIERYLAICRPFLYERLTSRWAAVMIVLCWLTPVFLSLVIIVNNWNHVGIEDVVACLTPAGLNICRFIGNIPFAFICSFIAFYIPVMFMGVCNLKIYITAVHHAHQIRVLEKAGNHNCKQKRMFKQESKAAKTLGIIMGCFSVCWFPFFILNLIDPIILYKIPFIPWHIALWLGYINSMMNPLLYYYFYRNFCPRVPVPAVVPGE